MEKRRIENEIVKVDNEYGELLQRCVAVIEQARTAIAKVLNTTSMTAYWEIGKLLYERKIDSKHGSAIVRRLSIDLKERYPDMGTSPRNLWSMKAFYVRYKDSDEKVLRSVAVLPWKHNLLLFGSH